MKIKSSICQEDKAILNVYTPNNRISKCVKQTLKGLKRQSHSYSWRCQHSSLSNQLLRLDRLDRFLQINSIFIVKSLCIPNICCNFAADFDRDN